MRVIAERRHISVFLNGTQLINVADGFNETATKHGIRVTDHANGVDSLTIAAR